MKKSQRIETINPSTLGRTLNVGKRIYKISRIPENPVELNRLEKSLPGVTHQLKDELSNISNEIYNLEKRKIKLEIALSEDKEPNSPAIKAELHNASVSERIAALGKLASFVRELFPELAELERAEAEGRASWVSRVGEKGPAQEQERPPLPEKAPEAWKDRASGRSEDPPSFLLRVYRPWLDNGLTRAHIRALDRPLYNALATHAHRHGVPEELQDFFASPSKGLDEELERRGIASPRDALERVGDRREAERLYSAAYRRERKEPHR